MSAQTALASLAPDAFQRGRAALASGETALAAAQFLAQVTADPADQEARYWLASALIAGGQDESAAQALAEARNLHAVAVLRGLGADMGRLQSDLAYGAELGRLCYANQLMGAASLAFGKAIDFDAPDASLLVSYGLSLQHQGRTGEAIDVFTAAAELFANAEVHQFLLYALFYDPDRLARVSHEAHRWAQLYAPPPTSPTFANSRDPGRRLRIGYFAPSLTRSQVATSTLAVFEAHDPAAVQIFLYCADPVAEAPTPDHCKVRGLNGLSDEAAAELIRADRIDVLVDCWGHTAGSRLKMFSHRPAPIQCGWINFMQTTGLSTIDYILHADSMEVAGEEAYFSERIWRTGSIMAPYRPTAAPLGPTPTPALANGFITFGSFNNPAKLSDETIAAWGAILRQRPGDRLLLKYSYFTDPVLQRVTQARLAAHGARPEQIIFAGHSKGADYAAAFGEIDLALDPSPCPGGTTTMDAICNGVPVLALKGGDFYARTCLPLLEPCGMGDLVADDWEAYVERALAITGDIAALNARRAAVRPGFEASPYRNEAGFTRKLEAMYRQMFQNWLEETA